MLKTMLAATTALAIAGSTLAYAQQNQPAPETPRAADQRPRMSAEDMQALTDARIAALKTGLKLTPDQEKNWPAVESAIRDLAKARADRVAEFRKSRADAKRPDLIERMRNRADAMSTRAQDLKRLADASEPLYKSLDDSQKMRMAALTRSLQRDGFATRMHRGGGQHGHHMRGG